MILFHDNGHIPKRRCAALYSDRWLHLQVGQTLLVPIWPTIQPHSRACNLDNGQNQGELLTQLVCLVCICQA